jgi:3-oxoacyl-[acyl-carrier-protein] synthase-3
LTRKPEYGGARITGIGHYLPERILTNFDLEKMVDTTDEWIVTRSGIRERHIAAEDEASSDLAYAASKNALAAAGVDPKDLDLIIVGTVTSDMLFPSTACVLQDRLGATKAAAFDVTAACSGFIYGLSIAHSLISHNKKEKALVIGVETLSRITDYEDRATCVLFGDGAGAAVLEPCAAGEGILSSFMQSDGSYSELLYLPGGGSRRPLNEERLRNREQYVKMKGNDLFKYAVRAMVDASRTVLKEVNLATKDIDFLIPHQANLRIIEGVRRRLKLPKEKVIVNIDRVGNTSAASIPIAMSEAVGRGDIVHGDKVLMVGFGGGLTWGAVLLQF